MNKEETIANTIKSHLLVIKEVENNSQKIIQASEMITSALRKGNTVFVAGNGGSASDAQHFAAELIGRFQLERNAYPSVCLNTDTSILTAVGNDYGFENIFARQIQGLGKEGDIFLGISTSGNSENIVLATVEASKKGLKTIALTGRDGGRMKELADLSLIISNKETARTQEAHITIIHILCKIIEESLVESSVE